MIPNTVLCDENDVYIEREYLHTVNLRKKEIKICLFLFFQKLGISGIWAGLVLFPKGTNIRFKLIREQDYQIRYVLSKSGIWTTVTNARSMACHLPAPGWGSGAACSVAAVLPPRVPGGRLGAHLTRPLPRGRLSWNPNWCLSLSSLRKQLAFMNIQANYLGSFLVMDWDYCQSIKHQRVGCFR